MSAPHTNIEKQKRRHKGPLIGMALVVVFVGIAVLYWTSQVPPPDASMGNEVPTDESGEPTSGTGGEPSPDANADPVQPAAPDTSTTPP